MVPSIKLSSYVPPRVGQLLSPQTDLPRIAKDNVLVAEIEDSVKTIPTSHDFYSGDIRQVALPKSSVHLVITSPPYWTLKKYPETSGQMGHIKDYDKFLDELDRVWKLALDSLVPGGRLICVVGDVCLSRRKNAGRHMVVPLHASIQERCRKIGFDNLAPIIWYKISNASYEVEGGSRFLGKPYEPNAIIKNDIEYIIMERKPGKYRSPTLPKRILSVISDIHHKKWFNQVWTGVNGTSSQSHPAPYPLELAERLVRMFSFVGDTILDPFMGTGTTNLACAKWGRNSIGVEVDQSFHEFACSRLLQSIKTSKVNENTLITCLNV
ncbi:MAG: site-specific DNA-methyltransferase [Proteobacteria bacterium]|nr:site-specific DNA-methyltransferase [Pseudomonadota bacterium]